MFVNQGSWSLFGNLFEEELNSLFSRYILRLCSESYVFVRQSTPTTIVLKYPNFGKTIMYSLNTLSNGLVRIEGALIS